MLFFVSENRDNRTSSLMKKLENLLISAIMCLILIKLYFQAFPNYVF